MLTRWLSPRLNATSALAARADSSPDSIPFTANSVAGLAIDDVLAEHQRLKRQLLKCAQGEGHAGLRADTLCFDDRCQLGQWLHGPAKAQLGHHQGFAHLIEQHRMFHIAASNVVALADAGKLPQAQHIAQVQLESFSRGVMQRLQAMQGWVQRRSQRQNLARA
jgi:hypothetical protein